MITLDKIDELDFEKTGGLIPAIIQDANTGVVLMLGYMNKESLEITKEKREYSLFCGP